jgi:hypothetical protein
LNEEGRLRDLECAVYLVAAVNAWLHAAMYFYFLLATTIARTEDQKLKYLWWGK